MCLYIDKDTTKNLRNKLKKATNGCILYKVMSITGNAIVFPKYKYKPGINKAGKLVDTEALGCINHGLHVFISKETAYKYKFLEEIVVPVRCYFKDFIAAGINKDAVFTQVIISPRTYRRYINKSQ